MNIIQLARLFCNLEFCIGGSKELETIVIGDHMVEKYMIGGMENVRLGRPKQWDSIDVSFI